MTITFDLQIVEKWLTPHFICIAEAQSENDDWAPNLANFFDNVNGFSALKNGEIS